MHHLLTAAFFSFIAFSSLTAAEREIKRPERTIIRNSTIDKRAYWQEVTDDELCKSALFIEVDGALLITNFKESIPGAGFGLSATKKPVSQMFRYRNDEQFIFSEACTATQSPNEGVAFIFEYAKPVVFKNGSFSRVVTCFVEDVKGNIHGSYDLVQDNTPK